MPVNYKFSKKRFNICGTGFKAGEAYDFNPDKYFRIDYKKQDESPEGITLYTLDFVVLDFWGRERISQTFKDVLVFNEDDTIKDSINLLDVNVFKG